MKELAETNSADNDDIEQSPIRALLLHELQVMEDQMSEVDRESKSKRYTKGIQTQEEQFHDSDSSKEKTKRFLQDSLNSDTNKTMSSGKGSPTMSLVGDPLAGLSGSNRATTTERRTTTTTTTKRTIKSSDDFIPAAADIQQLRSESRTSSISSTSPIFNNSASTQTQHKDRDHQGSTSSTTTTTTTTTKQAGGSTNKSWADGLQSPFIQDTEEGRVLKLRFDVTQYEPDEIVVKTVDNRLTVHAKHEEKSENRSVYREYNREFHLPDGTDVEQIRSSLSNDGVLTVDCPLPSPQLHGASRRIPIERA